MAGRPCVYLLRGLGARSVSASWWARLSHRRAQWADALVAVQLEAAVDIAVKGMLDRSKHEDRCAPPPTPRPRRCCTARCMHSAKVR